MLILIGLKDNKLKEKSLLKPFQDVINQLMIQKMAFEQDLYE